MMQQLLEFLQRATSPRILVLGDLILDRYVEGRANRISPEAPVLVLDVDREEERLGGAASVARLAHDLGANVEIAGVVGADAAGSRLQTLLDKYDIGCGLLQVDGSRPTTTKQRLVGRADDHVGQQVLRIDKERRDPLSPAIERELLSRVLERISLFDVILVSDYAKGVCTPTILAELIEAGSQRSLPILIDPARISDYSRYRGCTLLTPNRVEAELATNIAVACPRRGLAAAERLCHLCQSEAVMVTLDREGIAIVTQQGVSMVAPTRSREVVDVTGAGDTVLAMLGICRARQLEWPDSARLANLAAGVQVERSGVAQVTWQDILSAAGPHKMSCDGKIVTFEQLCRHSERHRQQGEKLVFTNGCFDLLHVGHASFLSEAAALGDVLIVAVNSDASVRRLKGPDRPIIAWQDRARLLASLQSVDYVVEMTDDTPHQLLRDLQPNVLIKGGAYNLDEVVGREVMWDLQGEVRLAAHTPTVSTTAIVNSILQRPETAMPGHVTLANEAPGASPVPAPLVLPSA